MLDTLFHALVRWLAPVLVFTTEEVWGTRYPDGGSVHLLEWPEIASAGRMRTTGEVGARCASFATQVTEAIEPLRRDKVDRVEPRSRSHAAGAARRRPRNWPSCSSSLQFTKAMSAE